MSDPFSSFIIDTRGFLIDLGANNSREWFQANKARYDRLLKGPAEMLLEQGKPRVEKLLGVRPKTKLFRPHRDLRFSKDKAPYHTYLHMLWGAPDDGPSFFFGISEEYVTAGAGWMHFAGPQLAAWREGIGAPEGAEVQAALRELKPRLGEPELKRVPAPYDADHPRAELLKRKSFVLWRDDLDDGHDPLVERIAGAFDLFWPVLSKTQSLLNA